LRGVLQTFQPLSRLSGKSELRTLTAPNGGDAAAGKNRAAVRLLLNELLVKLWRATIPSSPFDHYVRP